MHCSELVIATNLPPAVKHVSHGYTHEAASTFQVYETFEVSGSAPEMVAATEFRKTQKADFLAGDSVNPVLNNCPKFTLEQTERAGMFQQIVGIVDIQTLRREDGAEPVLEDEVLDELITLRAGELSFTETAALIADPLTADEYKPALINLLKQAGRSLYGLPNQQTAEAMMQRRLIKADTFSQTDDAVVKPIADYVLTHSLLKPNPNIPAVPRMKAGTIAHYQNILKDACQEDLDYAFAETGVKDNYTIAEMKIVADRYLDARGFSANGWTSDIIAGRTACATNNAHKILEIGANRNATQLTHTRVLQTIMHETEVHIGRQVRGSALASGLAGYGLANYVFFEEPLAGTVEEVYIGTSQQRGEQYVMAIAVSAGIDGMERDFRDSFDLLWRMSFVNAYNPAKDTVWQTEFAQNNAYNALVRIWRGMPTDVPGCVYTKDRAYENSEVISYLENDGKRLEAKDFMRLLSAKYDPRNAAQDAYVRSLSTQQ